MKDAYYFPHDANAKDDPKCVMLIEQLGLEGYGIFWILVETLRDQPDYKYPLSLLPAIARRYNTTAEKVKTVVANYGLFEIENDTFFYSNSLCNRMIEFENKREKRRLSAQKAITARWQKYERNTNVVRTNNNSIPSKVKESKEKESKEDNIKESTNILKKDELSNISPEQERYNRFCEWVEANAPFCFKNMAMPSYDEFYKLYKNHTIAEICTTISELENRKDLRKRYSNLYRTLLNWLKEKKG